MRKVIGLLMLFGWSGAASAALITYNYTGALTGMREAECREDGAGGCDGYDSTRPDSSSFFTGHTFSVGDTFYGQFTYDTEAILSDISDDGYQAVYLDGVVNHTLTIGTYSSPSSELPSTLGALSIVDGRRGRDTFYTLSWYSGPEWFSQLQLFFRDNTGSVFDSMEIPSELDPESFSSLSLRLSFLERSSNDQLHMDGILTSLVSAAPVPIPATTWLIGSALLGLGAARRKKA